METDRPRGYTIRIRGQRWGFEYSPIVHQGVPYLARWILYLAGYTLRLHRFTTGDERGPIGLHNHPFWFITFPLATYREQYWVPCPEHLRIMPGYLGYVSQRTVRAFRFHFRGVDFRHRVCALTRSPVWTIVISGRYEQQWGFFPTPDDFRPWTKKGKENTHT